MRICILGHTGFIGQTVFKYLKTNTSYVVFGMNKLDNNYHTYNVTFDIVINCAGTSLKYIANENLYSMITNELSIVDMLLKIKFKKLIHISTVDSQSSSNYGKLKNIVEIIIKQLYRDSIILRPSGLIGLGLKKNVVFDIINNNDVYSTITSEYNFMTTIELAKIIYRIIRDDIMYTPIYIGATSSISVLEIANIFHKHPKYNNKIDEHYNLMDLTTLTKFFTTKTSLEYITEFKNYRSYILND